MSAAIKQQIVELREQAKRLRESAAHADRYHDYYTESQQAEALERQAWALEESLPERRDGALPG
jgi:hypothetical protein